MCSHTDRGSSRAKGGQKREKAVAYLVGGVWGVYKNSRVDCIVGRYVECCEVSSRLSTTGAVVVLLNVYYHTVPSAIRICPRYQVFYFFVLTEGSQQQVQT
jgi:small-conductance mechanosensitive channel